MTIGIHPTTNGKQSRAHIYAQPLWLILWILSKSLPIPRQLSFCFRRWHPLRGQFYTIAPAYKHHIVAMPFMGSTWHR